MKIFHNFLFLGFPRALRKMLEGFPRALGNPNFGEFFGDFTWLRVNFLSGAFWIAIAIRAEYE